MDELNNIPGLVEDRVYQAKVKVEWAKRRAAVAEARRLYVMAEIMGASRLAGKVIVMPQRDPDPPDVPVFTDAPMDVSGSLSIEDEVTREMCQAITVFARRRFGFDLLWYLQSDEVRCERPEPVYNDALGGGPGFPGSPATTSLEMRFVGGPMPEGAEVTEESLVAAAADRANTLEATLSQERNGRREDLRREQDRREELEKELKDFRDEDSQLIRRLAAKTQARFGVDQRAMIIKFFRWIVLHQGVDIVKTGVDIVRAVAGRDQFIDGKFSGAMTEDMGQLLEELVDEFMGLPEAPVGAILPVSGEGGENENDL